MSDFEKLQSKDGKVALELRKSPMVLKLSLCGLLAPLVLLIFITFLGDEDKNQIEYLVLGVSCVSFFCLVIITIANFRKFLDSAPGLIINNKTIVNNSRMLKKEESIQWSDIENINKKFSNVEKAIIIKHKNGCSIINTSTLRADKKEIYNYLIKRLNS